MGTWHGSLELFGILFVILLIGFPVVGFGMELLFRKLDPVKVRNWLGGRNKFAGIAQGVVVGTITPFCTAIGMPFVISWLRAGVPFATVMAFLYASPLLNPFIPLIIGVLFGWQVVVAYAVIIVVLSGLLALAADALGMERFLQPNVLERRRALLRVGASAPAEPALVGAPAAAGGAPAAAGGTVEEEPSPYEYTPWKGMRLEAKPAWREAIRETRALLPRLTISIVIAAVFYALVNPGALTSFMGSVGFWLAVPIAALIAIPLYIREEAALPIGYALVQAGIGIGPVFAMIISGSGASLPEMAMLSTVFRRQLLIGFIGSVIVIALAAGYLMPLVF